MAFEDLRAVIVKDRIKPTEKVLKSYTRQERSTTENFLYTIGCISIELKLIHH